MRRIIAWCHCCRRPPSKHDATCYRLHALFLLGSANQTAISGLQSPWKILDCSGHGLKRSSTIGFQTEMETPQITKAESACLAHPAREAMSRKTCPKTRELVLSSAIFCYLLLSSACLQCKCSSGLGMVGNDVPQCCPVICLSLCLSDMPLPKPKAACGITLKSVHQQSVPLCEMVCLVFLFLAEPSSISHRINVPPPSTLSASHFEMHPHSRIVCVLSVLFSLFHHRQFTDHPSAPATSNYRPPWIPWIPWLPGAASVPSFK